MDSSFSRIHEKRIATFVDCSVVSEIFVQLPFSQVAIRDDECFKMVQLCVK